MTTPLSPASPPSSRWVPLCAALGIWVSALALVSLHIFRWNPLAAAPTTSLAEIYRQMSAAGEFSPTAVTFAFALAGIVQAASIALHFFFCTRPGYTRLRAFGWCLLGIWGSLLVLWLFAGWHIGMGLADTYAISGGNHARLSATSIRLVLLSLFVTALICLLRPGTRRPTQKS
ncbi:MAG: hypothetical protein Q3965_03010 [Rothia sp. (in: high G+C Gram-positive bacteria)]|nr:hypothetical protein [Rothia sp. (in: high G+C Gram-positive bacteria)]